MARPKPYRVRGMPESPWKTAKRLGLSKADVLSLAALLNIKLPKRRKS